jgi:N-carbamoylputrescine amidase
MKAHQNRWTGFSSSAGLMLMAVAITLVILAMSDARAQAKPVKIASAQIFCLDGDRSGNLVRVENAVIAAKAQGADLVAFPESCIFGWENPDAHHRACPIPGKDSDILCEMAKKHNIYIHIGLDEKDGDKLYGAAILIDDNGQILLKHRKNNVLAELMTPPYSEGKGVAAVDTPLGKIGVMICADSFRKNLLREMKDLKPDFVLIPYGWAAEETKWPEHGKELMKTVQKAAKAIGCPVVGTDLVGEISHGPWTGQVYGGQSLAADADGKVLFISKDRDSDLSVVTIGGR